MVSSLIIRRFNRGGFTLIELLVAMALLSMVTLVIALALRLSIDSWERGNREGEGVQASAVIPSLMEKQLGCLVKDYPFENRFKSRLPFCGKKQGLSFFTSYAPQGSPLQGLLRVAYVFNEDEQTLCLFEQAITREEHLDDEFDPLSDDWNNGSTPIGRVEGIRDFSLTYTDDDKRNPLDTDKWKGSWKCVSASLPTAVGVSLQVGSDSKSQVRKWVFPLGDLLP